MVRLKDRTLAITRHARARHPCEKRPIACSPCMALLPRLPHQGTATTFEEQFLVVHCTGQWAVRHRCDEFIWRSVMMRCNVMNDEFRTHEDNIAIWQEKIQVPTWGVKLTQFAFVDTKSNLRLPCPPHQLLKLREGNGICFPSREWLAFRQPANRAKRRCPFCTKVIALCQIIEVRHVSFFKG